MQEYIVRSISEKLIAFTGHSSAITGDATFVRPDFSKNHFLPTRCPLEFMNVAYECCIISSACCIVVSLQVKISKSSVEFVSVSA